MYWTTAIIWWTIVSIVSLLHCSVAAFSASHDITFELHQRNNQTATYSDDKFEVLVDTSAANNNTAKNVIAFDAKKNTRIVIHGFRSSRRSFLRYVRAFLKLGDCNVIVVNWLPGSVTYNYYTARNRAKQVNI